MFVEQGRQFLIDAGFVRVDGGSRGRVLGHKAVQGGVCRWRSRSWLVLDWSSDPWHPRPRFCRRCRVRFRPTPYTLFNVRFLLGLEDPLIYLPIMQDIPPSPEMKRETGSKLSELLLRGNTAIIIVYRPPQQVSVMYPLALLQIQPLCLKLARLDCKQNLQCFLSNFCQ